MKNIIWFLLFATLFSSCSKSDAGLSPNDQLKKDKATIDQYLATNLISAKKDSSGLRYVINKLGTGVVPTAGSTVSVQRTGTFLTGGTFLLDTAGYAYGLDQLLVGEMDGILLMPKGSTFTFYLPSGLAYGPYGSYDGSVGANVNIIMKITLLDDDLQLTRDVAVIDDLLAGKGDSLIKDISGLRLIIRKPGDGLAHPNPKSTVTVAFTGKFLTYNNGAQFTSSTNAVLSMSTSNLIKGWLIGLPYLSAGGEAVLYVPSGLAYGFSGSYPDTTIPRNAILVFDIKLLGLNN